MAPGYKRESWRPHTQPTSSWAPGRADTFRPAQEGPSASSSRHSPPPAGPSNYNSRPHAASSYRPAQDRDTIDRTPPSRPRHNDREDARRDGPSEGDRGWGTRGGPDSRRVDAGKPTQPNEPRAGAQEPHKGGYGRDYNETVRNNDIKKGTFRTKAQIQADLRDQQRGQRQNRSPPPDTLPDRPRGPSGSSFSENEARAADRSGLTRNGREDVRSNYSRPVRDESPSRGRPRSRSPVRKRDEPTRGRRASPDYGMDRSSKRRSPSRDSLYSPLPRKRSLSLIRDSLSPVDRKRAPTSPRGGQPKRQRDLSPSRSITPPRRRRSSTRSRSRSRERIRRPRSPSPRRNSRRSPSPRREEPRRPMRQWGRRPSPDRSPVSDRRDRSPPPPPRRRSPSPLASRNRAGSTASASTPARGPPFGGWGRAAGNHTAQQTSTDSYRPGQPTHSNALPPMQDRSKVPEGKRSPIPHSNGHAHPASYQHPQYQAQNDSTDPHGPHNPYPPQAVPPIDETPLPSGTVKLSFSGRDLSPVKGGWKSMTSHPPNKPAEVRQFFDDSASNTPITSRSSSPPPNTATSHDPPRDTDRPPLQPPEVYQKLLRDAQRDFDVEMEKLAPPYLRAAFQSWYAQPSRPDLPDFLGHYFGGRPQNQEITQMEMLLGLQNRFSRDQDELRDLQRQASQVNGRDVERLTAPSRPSRRDSGGHWSPPRGPRGQRESWSPQKRDAPLAGPPASANLVPIPEDRKRFSRSGPSGPEVTESRGEVLQRPVAEQPPVPADTETTASTPVSEPVKTLTKSASRVNSSGEVYERLAQVGEGTYGKVYKARNVESGGLFALKRIRMEGEKDGFPVTAMREIKLLQGLRHPNVMRLVEMMVSKGSVYMVSEYMDHDLTGVLAQTGLKFTPANLKSLNHQMLSGLAYLHESGILHRDMKGSNILLNAAGELKLADFGLARTYSKRKREDYTNRVITLWYRGPELLLGETVYGPEVDMWSAGCIMLELFCGKPVFQGSDEIHQLEVIYSIMGTPDESQWPGVKDLPWYELVKPKEALPSKFRESFKKWLTPAGIDLAQGLLEFDTTKRLSAEAALQAPYFTQEEPEMELPTQLANCGEHHEMSAKLERHRKRQQEGR